MAETQFKVLRTRLAVLALMVWGTTATATPPDIVTFDDEVFGISESHVFILRTVSDNHGLHVTGTNHLLLVGIDLATGARQLWPIYAIGRFPYSKSADDPDEVVAPQPWDGTINPYQILADHAAVPNTAIWTDREAGDRRIVFDDDMLSVTGTIATFTKSTTDVMADVEIAYNETADALPDYDRFGILTAQDMLKGPPPPKENCRVSDVIGLRAVFHQPVVMLAEIRCGYEDYDNSRMYVVMPAVAD